MKTCNDNALTHTDKPWIVNTARQIAGCNGDIGIVNKHNSLIAVAYYRSTDETVHNAHLIAAAPELLEACRLALLVHETAGIHSSMDPGQAARLRGAIIKAEGKDL